MPRFTAKAICKPLGFRSVRRAISSIESVMAGRRDEARKKCFASTGFRLTKGEDMPWWVDVAYVVGTVVIFIVFDLCGKWVDKL